jgi:hypothetical protein
MDHMDHNMPNIEIFISILLFKDYKTKSNTNWIFFQNFLKIIKIGIV